MKLPVYQQIAMELRDLRFQQALDREAGIDADFSIVPDLTRNIEFLVLLYLPDGCEFDFGSFVNRLYFMYLGFTITVEVTLLHGNEGMDITIKAPDHLHENDPSIEDVRGRMVPALMKEAEV